jgi:hypothetical protein
MGVGRGVSLKVDGVDRDIAEVDANSCVAC